jgi:hypothetical protein
MYVVVIVALLRSKVDTREFAGVMRYIPRANRAGRRARWLSYSPRQCIVAI